MYLNKIGFDLSEHKKIGYTVVGVISGDVVVESLYVL